MKRSVLLVAVVGLSLLVASAADARGSGKMGRRDGQGPFQNLDPEVSAKIQDLRTEFMESTVELRTELYGAEEKFKLVLMDTDASDKEIMEAFENVQNFKKELGERRMEHMLQVRKELPEDARGMLSRMGMHRGIGERGMSGHRMGGGHGRGRGHFGGSGFGSCRYNDDGNM